MQPKRYFLLQASCPSLLADRYLTYLLSSICVGNVTNGFSGKSLKYNLRYSRKGLYSTSKVPFIIDRSSLNLYRFYREHGK